MNKDEYTELLRDAVIAHGYEVGMNSPDCFSHKSTHENCQGCQYELGCSKLVSLQLLGFTHPKPNSVEAILKAETAREIHAVLDGCETWLGDA